VGERAHAVSFRAKGRRSRLLHQSRVKKRQDTRPRGIGALLQRRARLTSPTASGCLRNFTPGPHCCRWRSTTPSLLAHQPLSSLRSKPIKRPSWPTGRQGGHQVGCGYWISRRPWRTSKNHRRAIEGPTNSPDCGPPPVGCAPLGRAAHPTSRYFPPQPGRPGCCVVSLRFVDWSG